MCLGAVCFVTHYVKALKGVFMRLFLKVIVGSLQVLVIVSIIARDRLIVENTSVACRCGGRRVGGGGSEKCQFDGSGHPQKNQSGGRHLVKKVCTSVLKDNCERIEIK